MIKYITIIILWATFTGCTTGKSNTTKENTEKFMEPRILAIGRLQSTLDILVEEWERYGRNVIASEQDDGFVLQPIGINCLD